MTSYTYIYIDIDIYRYIYTQDFIHEGLMVILTKNNMKRK